MIWLKNTIIRYRRVPAYVALLALIAVLAGGILFLIVRSTTDDPCNLYLLQMASEQQKNVVFSCQEFWINRYQGLIGNIITACVAFITLSWLTGQLTAANLQAAVAAAQGLRTVITEIDEEDGHTETATRWARNIATDLGRYRDVLNFNGQTIGNANKHYFDDIERMIALHRTFTARDPNNTLGSERATFIDSLVLARNYFMANGLNWVLYNTVLSEVQAKGNATDKQSADMKRIGADIERARAGAQDSMKHIMVTAVDLRERLRRARTDTWAQIREFEQTAVSHR